MQATDGAFYGTAGVNLQTDARWLPITLASEAGSSAGLIEGEDGDLYGTTTGGGTSHGVVCDSANIWLRHGFKVTRAAH